MNRSALVVLMALAPAAPVIAGVGNLGVYPDNRGFSCSMVDNGNNGLLTTYVVHKFAPGDQATGCRFRIEPPAGATWFYIAFASTFVLKGGADIDLEVAYGMCAAAPTLVGYASWFSLVPSPAWGQLSVKATASGHLTATDCLYILTPLPTASPVTVNPDASCSCDVLGTEQTSWGSIKALYR